MVRSRADPFISEATAAFRALVKAFADDKVTAIAVPSLHHFAVIGEPAAIKLELERTTGARVLVAGYAP